MSHPCRAALGALAVLAIFVVSTTVVPAETPAKKKYVDQQYPDFGFLPPPSAYSGRVFRLSQRYPLTEPDASLRPEFLKIDYTRNWKEYLLAAQDYCFRDNVLGGDEANDFDAAARDEPTWFHVPWQHYGPSGREGVHGLTKEAPVPVQALAPSQTYSGGQMYAVGLYNVFGGYTIGKVWADRNHPNPAGILFSVGTVVMKVLFTDVPTEQVPSLANPLKWRAYVTEDYASGKRVFKDLALVQMDLMVRDDRSPTGWVFGNYQYNGNAKRASRWKNLVPLGIQWGNDPGVNDGWGAYTNPIPGVTRRNPNLKETIINPDDSELPPTHLGWNGRLNGPADNPLSSCMSCHMTAQAPAKSPMSPLFLPRDQVPAVGSRDWMRWFQNVRAGELFDAGQATRSTDFSLQLAASLQNYYEWRDQGSKLRAGRYGEPHVPPEYPIRRAKD